MAAPLVVVSEAVHGWVLLASQPRWQHRIALHSLIAGSTASDTSLSSRTDTGIPPECGHPVPTRRCSGTVQPLWMREILLVRMSEQKLARVVPVAVGSQPSKPAPQPNVPPLSPFEECVGDCQGDTGRGVRVFYPQNDTRLLVFNHARDSPRETSLVGEH
ncbi:hypothetical protein C8Q70DRAFT_936293 [Cubamyces menziesii]|nr:hypothetical protein C8Q70DRAFT_936293 [Cubamyces menziesii]